MEEREGRDEGERGMEKAGRGAEELRKNLGESSGEDISIEGLGA